MKKTKVNLTILVFGLVLFGGLALHILLPDLDASRAERRRLAQFPAPTTKTLLSGAYAQEVETYLLDQFPGRDGFRTIKAAWTFYAMGQKDNNGVYLAEGSASKLDKDLDEKQVRRFGEKMTALQEKYFPNSKTYVAVIPDKNYYLAEKHGFPSLDYVALLQLVREGLSAEFVDLTQSLEAEDYYKTDSHWRQERLGRVVETLGDALGVNLPPVKDYEAVNLEGFRGVYYGQSALPLPAETLTYLENDVTKQAVVTGPELDGDRQVYDPERFLGMDGYDVFLHGAQAVLKLENPLADTDKELIVFRDSYGSSLAPLLLPGYKTITMVDIRYVDSRLLDQFVDFHGQDVLIAYSTTVINSAGILR